MRSSFYLNSFSLYHQVHLLSELVSDLLASKPFMREKHIFSYFRYHSECRGCYYFPISIRVNLTSPKRDEINNEMYIVTIEKKKQIILLYLGIP